MVDKPSLLAVFAHPGDESWGPGATLVMYAQRGVEVTLVCATRGEDSPWGESPSGSPEELGETRVQELAAACDTLGIRHWTVLGYPDGALGQNNARALEKDIVRWVREVQPQAVSTHYPEGAKGHPDHNVLSRITTKAYLEAGCARRYSIQLKEGLTPWEPQDLYYSISSDVELLSKGSEHLVLSMPDVSRFASAKARALRCYASQEQCWRGLIKSLQLSPTLIEPLLLANTRLTATQSQEEALIEGEVCSRA
jgi:LmbE family N-acetylglucosaminyl deacetylase